MSWIIQVTKKNLIIIVTHLHLPSKSNTGVHIYAILSHHMVQLYAIWSCQCLIDRSKHYPLTLLPPLLHQHLKLKLIDFKSFLMGSWTKLMRVLDSWMNAKHHSKLNWWSFNVYTILPLQTR